MAKKRFSANDYQLVEATKLPNGETEYTPIMGATNDVTQNNIPSIKAGAVLTDTYDMSLSTGDIITAEGNINGQKYLKISKSPFNAGVTTVRTKSSYKMPFYMTAGITLSQKLIGVDMSFGAVGANSDGVVEQTIHSTEDVAVSSIVLSGSGTLMTITTTTPHARVAGDRFAIVGNTISVLNVGPVRVLAVLSLTQFSVTVAVGTGADGTYNNACNIVSMEPIMAKDGAMYLMDTASATQAYLVTRQNDNSKNEGTLLTVPTTAPGYTSTRYAEGIFAQSFYRIEGRHEAVIFAQNVVDNVASQTTGTKRMTQVPDTDKSYKLEVNAVNAPNFSRPVAKIVSADKSGSTTTTIVTNVAHGLSNTSRILTQGCSDAGNFPNLVAYVNPTVVNATTFTCVIPGAVTAGTTGGVVWLLNGNSTVANQTSALKINTIEVINNEMIVSMSGTVGSLCQIGDSVNLYGLSSGVSAYEQAYVVIDSVTATLTLRPMTGVTLPNIASTPTGGLVIKRTDVCVHFASATENPISSVEIAGMKPMGDADIAVKTIVTNTVSVNGTVTANTTETTLIATTPHNLTSTASTNATSVKTTAGSIYSCVLANGGASHAYVKFYNKASTPTVGTDIPTHTVIVPAGTSKEFQSTRGNRFSTGIAYAITNAYADSDTAAILAGQVKVYINYI